MAKDNNILPNNNFNPLGGGDSNGGEQPRKQMFSGAGDFFNKVSERIQDIRTPQDEIDSKLNNAFFLSDIGGRTDGLLSSISVTPNEAGIIEGGISPEDIAPKDVGVKTVGTVGGQIIGSQPLTVASAGLLPLGLMEKRRKAMRDAATAKNKKLEELMKRPTTAFEYQTQLTNHFMDRTQRFLDEIQNDTSVIGDFSDPRYQKFYDESLRESDASTALQAISGVIQTLQTEVEEGERMLNKEAINIINKFKTGSYDFRAISEDPKAFNSLLDDYNKLKTNLSISKVGNDMIIDKMQTSVNTVINRLNKGYYDTDAENVLEKIMTNEISKESIRNLANSLQLQTNYNEEQLNSLVDFVHNKIQKQIESEIVKVKRDTSEYNPGRPSNVIDPIEDSGETFTITRQSGSGELVTNEMNVTSHWTAGGTPMEKSVTLSPGSMLIQSESGSFDVNTAQSIPVTISDVYKLEGSGLSGYGNLVYKASVDRDVVADEYKDDFYDNDEKADMYALYVSGNREQKDLAEKYMEEKGLEEEDLLASYQRIDELERLGAYIPKGTTYISEFNQSTNQNFKNRKVQLNNLDFTSGQDKDVKESIEPGETKVEGKVVDEPTEKKDENDLGEFEEFKRIR